MFGEMVISLSGVPVEKIKQEERTEKGEKKLKSGTGKQRRKGKVRDGMERTGRRKNSK